MDVSLVIGTCDSYDFLWDNFKTLEERYLPFKKCPRIAFTETKDFGEGYITSNSKGPWSNRLLAALEKVETEYTFFVLEDYFFTKHISEQDIDTIVYVLDSLKKDKFMLATALRHYHLHNYLDIPKMDLFGTAFFQHPESPYLTSIQPAVWRTSYLKSVVKEDWTPWDLEVEGSKDAQHVGAGNMVYHVDDFYFNAVRKGCTLSPGWEEVKEKEDLPELMFPK